MNPTPTSQNQTHETLESEKVYRKGIVTVRDLIAPSAMQVQPRYLRLGSKFVSTLFVVSYPRYLNVGWFSPIINLSLPMDISMFFYPIDATVVLKQLRDKVGQIEAQLSLDEQHGAPRDPVRQTALRDIEKLRDDITQGIEHFFQFALYLTLYADTEKELNELSEHVEGLLGGKLVYSKRVMFQSEQGFNSTLPLGNDELFITFNFNTSPTASMFPFTSSELSSDNGILYGLNQHNNSLILFDRFSLQNANSV
ncbi:MAG: conjugal transfer protein TraC, partial [Candidatus Kerfeldbacteria bacterium]|nr:conjugal transfer protein TraC [Candidatus Kerfeldbacteria bacterium]